MTDSNSSFQSQAHDSDDPVKTTSAISNNTNSYQICRYDLVFKRGLAFQRGHKSKLNQELVGKGVCGNEERYWEEYITIDASHIASRQHENGEVSVVSYYKAQFYFGPENRACYSKYALLSIRPAPISEFLTHNF